MLLAIRDQVTGIVGMVIIGLLIIPFALWGVYNYFEGGGIPEVAEVNGKPIPLQALQQEMSRQQDQLRAMFNGNIPDGFMNAEQLRENAVQALIERSLVEQTAEEYNYQISNEQLFAQISSFPAFQKDGKFSPELYERALANQLRSKEGFEYLMRNDMLVQQVARAVPASAFVTDTQLADFNRLNNQTRDIEYFVVSSADQSTQHQPDEAAIQEYYDNNQDLFMSEEKLAINYVVLDPKKVAEEIVVSEDELRDFYAQQSDVYAVPETRKARHILIKLPRDASDEEKAKVDAKLLEIEDKIAEGADFSELAKMYSEDALSVNQGGDLGFLAKQDVDPLFAERLFTLSINEISEPIRTDLGYQIIQLEVIEEAQVPPFEEMKTQVENEYRARKAETRFVELSEALANASFDAQDNLQSAAEAINSEVKETPLFTRQRGTNIADFSVVRDAAFSNEVLINQRNSELISLPDGRAVALRLLKHQPATQIELNRVRGQIIAQLKQEAGRQLARELGEQAVVRLTEGESIESIAQSMNATANTIDGLGVADNRAPRDIREIAFRMSRPSSEAGLQQSSGDYVVMQLFAVHEAGAKSNDETARPVLANAYGQREAAAMLKAMQERADIKIYNTDTE